MQPQPKTAQAAKPAPKQPATKAATSAATSTATSAASGGAASSRISDEVHGNFYYAVDNFIRAECSMESTTFQTSVIEAIGATSSLSAAFEVPIKMGALSMDSALRWALFMREAPARATEFGDEQFAGAADLPLMMDTIAAVYDLGVQSAVYDHFEVEDEDDEDDEDETE